MAAHRVRALLMGGQACVFYGAAEFSRDTDLVVLADPENLRRLGAAMKELAAECIAVPPFEAGYLERGHAIHFRCNTPETADMRVDVMSKLRGVDSFPLLWERRTSVTDEHGTTYELIALPDLVQAKKTQCSKDWPMLQRLVEAHYLRHRPTATPEQQGFWLAELRTPELLIEASQLWPQATALVLAKRPLLTWAQAGKVPELEAALEAEERAERESDRVYWSPLKAELERLRQAAVNRSS